MAVIAVAVLIMAPTAARATVTYAFDPTLSLTGDCSVSEIDPVADPGLCPIPPGVAGEDHPAKPFAIPTAVTADKFGDIYVASYGSEAQNGAEGRIDVFAPNGSFISDLVDEAGPKAIAVDGVGNLYVSEFRSGLGSQIRRFPPSVYEPASGKIDYGGPPEPVVNGKSGPVAVDPENNRLYALTAGGFSQSYTEYGSAGEGNKPIATIGEGTLHGQFRGLALNAGAGSNGLLYASDQIEPSGAATPVVRVFELGGTHKLIETIDGSCLPAEEFASEPSLAVSEKTGDLFAYAEEEIPLGVNRLTAAGCPIEKIQHEFKKISRGIIGIDNGASSPNKGDLFVPSHPQGKGHAFAFGPSEETAPEVEALSFANVSSSEAELTAKVDPGGVTTHYTLQYTTQASFEAEGFAAAQTAGGGQLPAQSTGLEVKANASGLSPGTAYEFRVFAENKIGEDEAQGSFSTYAAEEAQFCPNEAARTGASAGLADCRAYELVTPPDTNARAPLGIGFSSSARFPTRPSSPAGDRVSFHTEGGTIPGFEGTGSLQGDQYLASRGPGGWSTASAGPSGAESSEPSFGGTSADQGYSFWEAGESGSAVLGGETAYVRYPDGHSGLVGRGSKATDTQAKGLAISPGGTHIVFSSPAFSGHPPVQLEPDAPPNGTQAIYDRTADEVTHVVSLLPGPEGTSITPAAGENATYAGASEDGRGVAFTIGGTLYLRLDDAVSYEVGKGATFAGIAEGGGRVFYLKEGNLFAFDASTQEAIAFSTTGNVTPVNVARGGTIAYFVSPTILGGKNPNNEEATKGAENLYLSREGAISFVGTVTKRDVEGELGETEQIDGLGLWMSAAQQGRPGKSPSRTTPEGIILFSSRAKLGSYDPEGHAEIYRYDPAAPSLECISCNPTGAPASGQASLQSIEQSQGEPGPFSAFAYLENLRSDGRRAIFQSTEALVAADTDQLQDVYEWEEQGVGGCDRPGGCVFLISSGRSSQDDYLYGVSENGDDVFFTSTDLLVAADQETTSSIYDARVGGGFPEEAPSEPCQGEGCRPSLSASPPLLGPESGVQAGAGQKTRCPKGKHLKRHPGSTRCVKTRHRHHAAKAKKRAAR